MKDVAKAAGVSAAVVSAVLNGSSSVRASEETKELVRRVAKELRYVPNYAAQNLRRVRTDVLAVVVPRLGDPVYAPMLEGIYEAASRIGLSVLLGDETQATVNAEFLRRLTGQGHVDGVLLRANRLSGELLRELTLARRPIIALEPTDGATWLALEDSTATRAGVRHLLDHGHRSIGFLGGSPEFAQTTRRVEAFEQALRESGIEPVDTWIVRGDQSSESGYDLVREMFSEGRDTPTALVINNVTTAVGVVAALVDLRVRIPHDLSIVALHDSQQAAFVRPGLDTIRMPMRELGKQAVDAIVALRHGETLTSRYVTDPPPTLIQRGSVAENEAG